MAPIRVLVVDDSVVIRRLVSGLLAEDPTIEVVGSAINGRAALQKVEALKPDIVTMDIEMPEMDGIEAVRAIRATGNRVPIIMFSTLTERGAVATFDALSAGASDYVSKPANVGSVTRSMEQVREALIPRIKSLVPRAAAPSPRAPEADNASPVTSPTTATGRLLTPPPAAIPTLRPRRIPAGGYSMLVIGSSTGGPEALTTLLGSLPPLPVPVVIVQHMPPIFTRQFASRLDRQCSFPVREAEAGMPLDPGTVTLAPGDYHLTIERAGRTLLAGLNQSAPENFCRPAVDVMFRSAAANAGGPVLAAVLTGMGADGAQGSKHIVDAGGSVLAQDRASSVVWGMPGAVAALGTAEQLIPLSQIGNEIQQRLTLGRSVASPAGAIR